MHNNQAAPHLQASHGRDPACHICLSPLIHTAWLADGFLSWPCVASHFTPWVIYAPPRVVRLLREVQRIVRLLWKWFRTGAWNISILMLNPTPEVPRTFDKHTAPSLITRCVGQDVAGEEGRDGLDPHAAAGNSWVLTEARPLEVLEKGLLLGCCRVQASATSPGPRPAVLLCSLQHSRQTGSSAPRAKQQKSSVSLFQYRALLSPTLLYYSWSVKDMCFLSNLGWDGNFFLFVALKGNILFLIYY